LTIIIPRHINRTDEIKRKIEELGLNVICRSSNNKISKNTDIYLVDTYGETKKFYKYSNTVFLGGSLPSSSKKGGQNPIEPARLGSTIIHGPNIDNFKEVYKLFNNKKISYQAKNIYELKKLVERSIVKSKNKKNKYSKIKNIGARILKKTYSEIVCYIK
jgi:3-deoxy-D-manno-octulosonic-acid transferase